jgi:hypothetical protein
MDAWGGLTSLSVIEKFAMSENKGYALIVSHEFPMGNSGVIYPNSFSILSHKQLEYKLPALTLGEACTLTLVKMDAQTTPAIRVEMPEGATLCTLPYRNYKNILWNSPFIINPEEFHAYHSNMSKMAALKNVSILNAILKGMDINLVPHSYTRAFEKLKRLLDFRANIVNYFHEYGNTATSSIPLNLEVAIRRGHLDRSKQTYAWCASAGLKINATRLNMLPIFNSQHSL